MKLVVLSILAAPTLSLACGGYFYSAPPTLDHYPERLPVKTMRELLEETQPPPANAATFDQLEDETKKIVDGLTEKSRDDSRKAIDETLARNRAGEYRKRIANCLYDFRDLLESADAPSEEVRKYAAWRISAMDWDNGITNAPPSERRYEFTPGENAARKRAWQSELDNTTNELRENIEKAFTALKPHWLILAGAWQFKHAQYAEAGRLFQEVIKESPQHPRAEVAQLMLARARMEEWSEANREAEQKDWDKYHAVTEALDVYVGIYPHGRFAADIPGWRGGLAREIGNLSEAISCYLQQIDFTDHPEIVHRAVRECEACFDKVEGGKLVREMEDDVTGTGLPLAEIARRPVAALALVYHFLDSENRNEVEKLLGENEDADHRVPTDEIFRSVVRMRRAGRQILPALAKAVADQKENYGGKVWKPKYLAILAWAASESGDHAQAVRLCELAGPSIEKSDDLLFVRAVALQRAGRLGEAIAAYRVVQVRFPNSALSEDIRFRLAAALRDNHQTGLAFVEMARMELGGSSSQQNRWHRQYDPNGAEKSSVYCGDETGQWVDTLLQFGPLSELERALPAASVEPEIPPRLRRMLRLRYLAHEDFVRALGFAEPKVKQSVPEDERETGRPEELNGDEWMETIAKMSRLKREIGKRTGNSRAEKMFAMAETWASVRGRLTLPSVEDEGVFGDEFYKGWASRYRNAVSAGYSSEAAAEELEDRDELRHAYRYYLQAADASNDKKLIARALWRANDALRNMAELSPWSTERAFAKNDSAMSRQLHERLLRECPNSPEAKRLSVWWSFPPAAELHWMPGRMPYDAEAAIADAFDGLREEPGGFGGSPQWQDNRDFERRLKAVAAKADEWEPARLLEEFEKIRRDFLPVYTSSRGSWVMNHLDDLTLFLHEPGVTPAVRAKYLAARLANDPPNRLDPEMKPWADYLTFLALVREEPVVDRNTGSETLRPMSIRMREFLDKFPHSQKREAAMARLAVALVRETRGRCHVEKTAWPDAPKLGGYLGVVNTPPQPFDRERVFAGLDAYEREFPQGRYQAEIRLWRGIASIEAEDWKTAANLLVATLDDPAHRDLHLDAAINLADVFMRLLDEPEKRPEVIVGIRENPSAQKRFRQFTHSETLGVRLSCLDGYLTEAFAKSGKQ
jgi:outer membrane protein assembly factor BamD (BamD/ComL family)